MSEITRMLERVEAGDVEAVAQLTERMYGELRRLAARHLARERSDHSLQPTELVNEAFLRLFGGEGRPHWTSRKHLMNAATAAMRRIRVDRARRRRSQKRGGNLFRVELDAELVASQERTEKLLALDEALSRLEESHPRQAELVKLRYFAGLTIQEAAEVLGVSTTTADRDWTYARAWLQREMAADDGRI